MGKPRYIPEGIIPGNNGNKDDDHWSLLVSAMNAGRRESVRVWGGLWDIPLATSPQQPARVTVTQ